MTINPALLVVLSALISAASAITATYLSNRHNFRITRLTKESEERKHQKGLVFNAALENWKQQLELAKAGSINQVIRPLDDYIVHMAALSEMLLDKPINKSVVTERLNEFQEFVDAVDSFRRNKIMEMSKRSNS